MYIIDLALRNTPAMLSVQRKEKDGAEALYQQVTDAIKTGNPVVMELTCDQQVGKKFAVLVSEISAVQLSEKSGSGMGSGRVPGFFAMTE